MFKPYIDLHTHSTLSGGTMTPQQLAEQARAAGVRILAITDHCIEDLTAIRKAFPEITFIHGVQIRCIYTQTNGKESEIHIVGLGFDPKNEKIQIMLSRNQSDHHPINTINALHYVSLEEAVEAIRNAGGVAVLSHLFYYQLEPQEYIYLVQHFKRLAGNDGALEVYYPAANTAQRLTLLELADQFGLMYSAGSNFNGSAECDRIDNRFSHACCAELLTRLGIEVDDPLSKEQIVVLGGFSGSGKGTLIKGIPADFCVHGKKPVVITSVTTRKPRDASENYIFVSKDVFGKMANEDAFLEYNEAYSDNSYGTPKEAVFEALQNNRLPVLEIDQTGLIRLLTEGRVNPKQILRIFIVATPRTLLERLRNRKSEDEASLRKRLNAAVKEASMVYRLYQSIIDNDVLHDSVQNLMLALRQKPVIADFSESIFQSEMEEVLQNL